MQSACDFVAVAPQERWGEIVVGGQVIPQDGAFLQAPQFFDARFFSISPAEAIVMEVQHRLILEHIYCAMHWCAVEAKSRFATCTLRFF